MYVSYVDILFMFIYCLHIVYMFNTRKLLHQPYYLNPIIVQKLSTFQKYDDCFKT